MVARDATFGELNTRSAELQKCVFAHEEEENLEEEGRWKVEDLYLKPE